MTKACTRPAKPSRVQRWDRNIKTRYGVSGETYMTMLANQDNACAICGLQCSTGRRLAVDHDHATNIIRDLLCHKCNVGLGAYNDDVELLAKAIEYLKRHAQNDSAVPGETTPHPLPDGPHSASA